MTWRIGALTLSLIVGVLDAHIALPALQLFGDLGLQAPLARELALAFGDDHLQPRIIRPHRFLVDLGDFADLVVVHRAQPLHAESGQCALNGPVRARRALSDRHHAGVLGRRGNQLLRAGRGGIAILHDHQHAIALVEQVGGHAGE